MRERPATDAQHLGRILEAAQEARHIVEGHTEQSFSENRVLQLALQKLIQNIGEAASHLSSQFRREHDHIPWSMMTGMRHRLVHAFHAVDNAVVWDTVAIAIPDLIAELQRILDDE